VLLIASMFFVGFGALIMGNALYWRLHAGRVTGVVVGTRPARFRGGENDRKRYCAVYRYFDRSGQPVEAESPYATLNYAAMRAGREVPLLVFEGQPTNVREARAFFLEFFSFAFIFGGFLAFPPLFEDRLLALEIALLVLGIGGGYILSGRRIRSARISNRTSSMREGGEPGPPAIDVMDAQGSEEQVHPSAGARARKAAFALLVVGLGVAMAGSGLDTGHMAARLAIDGVEAAGRVVGFKEQADSDGAENTPLIEFATADRGLIRFEDARTFFGSFYHVGDKVRVVYLSDRPSRTATIDSPLRGLILSVMLMIFGGTIVFLGSKELRDLAVGPR
jgi:hypothetical protein